MTEERPQPRRVKLLDVEAIAKHFDVAQGTVARWASEDRWTKYGRRSRRLWDLREVQESFRKRHPKQPPDVR